MKRLLIIALALALTLTGCMASDIEEPPKVSEYNENAGVLSSGIWISFSEINAMLNSEKRLEAELEEVVANCERLEIQNVYIHVRAFCDSLFKSDYFPLLEGAKGYDYDVFEYILKAFHEKNIKVHAWINPYRVLTSSSDIEALNSDSPAYKWLKDENPDNDVNVCFSNGIYLNPAEADVRELVINGVREIVSRYEVDGIHFDDYFYPTVNPEFDSKSYENYKETTKNSLSLEDWRRANVNALINGCYTAIKFLKKDTAFSVSPAADIERNFNELYADIEEWVKEGYVDAIIPQIYFGFEYPNEKYAFENCLTQWKKLMSRNHDIALIIGLASYKIGTDSEPDREEWQRDTDIIARQVKQCFEDGRAEGYVLFSYSSTFSSQELNLKQRAALEDYLKGK